MDFLTRPYPLLISFRPLSEVPQNYGLVISSLFEIEFLTIPEKQ
jgi:hypothetical protein